MLKKLLIGFLVTAISAVQAENLLSNSRFEHGLAGYLLGDCTSRQPEVSYTLTPFQNGNALSFNAGPEERIALYLPESELNHSVEYEISFMGKSSVADLPLIVSEYVRKGGAVGSAGKFFTKLTTEWKRYTFRYKPSGAEKWGGFRIVKNYGVNKIPVVISLAELYWGPADGKTSSEPEVSASFKWENWDPRLQPGTLFKPEIQLINHGKAAKKIRVNWCLRSLYDNVITTTGSIDVEAQPGKTIECIPILTPHYNGIFRLEGNAEGVTFINKIKLAVTPKVRVKVDDLPVNIGINSPATEAARYPIRDDEMAFFAECGNTFVRTWDTAPPFIWREIEPQDGQFRWDAADRLVNAAEKAGMEVMPVLGGMFFTYPDMKPFGTKEPEGHASPVWLYQKSPVVSCPPNMPQFTRKGRKTILPPVNYWERMVTNIAKRYHGRIHYYEIMNEPNLCLTAQQYLPYLESAYQIIKKTDSNATVVGICATGDFNGHIMDFVNQMLQLGAGKYCDAISFHPYNNMFEDSPKSGESVIAAFHDYLKQNDCAQLKLWNTELYYLNPASTGGESEQGADFHPGYLIRRYLLDASQGVNVSILVPGGYMLGNVINDNFQGNSKAPFFSNNLMPNYNYIASAAFAQILFKTRFQEAETLNNAVRLYKFNGDNKAVAAVFLLNPDPMSPRTIFIDNQGKINVAIRNLLDNPIPPDAQGNWVIPCSPIPFYIITANQQELNKVIRNIKIK